MLISHSQTPNIRFQLTKRAHLRVYDKYVSFMIYESVILSKWQNHVTNPGWNSETTCPTALGSKSNADFPIDWSKTLQRFTGSEKKQTWGYLIITKHLRAFTCIHLPETPAGISEMGFLRSFLTTCISSSICRHTNHLKWRIFQDLDSQL